MKPQLLLIGAGQWILDWCEYYQMAYTLIQKPELYIPGSAKAVLLIDYENDPRVWDHIDGVCAAGNVVACLTSTEPALKLAFEVAQKYQLPYRSCKDIRPIKDKWRMRQLLGKSQLNAVPCALVENPLQVQEFLANHQQIIVKPQTGVGSINVSRINADSPGEIDKLTGYPLLAERFIGGQEYSVEAFSFNGQHQILGIAQKQVEPNGFVEQSHIMPAPMSPQRQQLIVREMTAFLAHMGIENGPSHTELKVEDEQVYFIETHNRVAGDDIASLLELVSGFNVYQYLIGWPSGKVNRPDTPLKAKGCAMIEFLFAEQGTLEALSGLAAVRVMPGVAEVKVYPPVGEQLSQTCSSYNRLGHILVHGDNAEHCRALIDTVKDRLKLTISPSPAKT